MIHGNILYGIIELCRLRAMLHFQPTTNEKIYNCLISTNGTSATVQIRSSYYWLLNGIGHIEHFTKFHTISVAYIPLNQHCLHINRRSCFQHLKTALLNKVTIHQRWAAVDTKKDAFADIKLKVILYRL